MGSLGTNGVMTKQIWLHIPPNQSLFAPMSVGGEELRRVGVWLDPDYSIKREIETHAGCQRFANEAGWDLVLDPVMAETLKFAKGKPPYDGVLGRVGKPLALAARKAGIPAVNVRINSSAEDITSVLLDFEASGRK